MFSGVQEFLSGKKTYIVALIYGVAVLAEKFLGMDIPGFEPGEQWFQHILGAVGISTVRAGIAKSAS